MMFFLQLCIDASLLGGIYTLMAIGLSLIHGVARVINFAHGESVMLGAYGAFWCFQLWGIDPLIALPLLCVIGTVSGYILFRLVVARVLQAPQENQLLLTFGISLVLQSIALICWSADERSANPPYALSSFGFADLVVGGGPLIGFSVAAVLVTGLFLWLRYAEFGRAARAIADNRDAALLMGINVPALYALVFGLSTALGVATGAVMSFLLPITPLMGFPILIKGFAIIVLGGLGSVTGTVLGAFVLSFAETAIGYYVPDGNGWAEAVSFALLFFIGEKKKLELARALAVGAKLLLLDEVMGGLTRPEVGDLIATLRRIHASGVTILMIEHIVEAILALSQRVLVLNFGQKLFEGTPREVMEHPAVIESYLGRPLDKSLNISPAE